MGISKRNMDDLFNKLSRGESVNGSFNESEGLRNDVEEKKKLLNVFDEGISIKEMLTLEQIKQRTSNINDLLINTINDSNGQKKQQIKKNIPNSASKLIGSNNHKIKQRNKISPFVNDNHTTIINNFQSRSPNKQTTSNNGTNTKLSFSNSRNNHNSTFYNTTSSYNSKKSLSNSTMKEVVSNHSKNPYNLNTLHKHKALQSTSNTTSSNSIDNKIKKTQISSKLSKPIHEEYDYMKILSDLRSIFGEDLEYFNENLLFNNLDEMSNKGLIKGLLMLAHQQDKQIKILKQQISEMNVKHLGENKVKMDSMVILTLQLNKMNTIFKEYINENQNVLKQAKHYN